MTRWTRAAGDTSCGNCSAPIADGDPLLVLSHGAFRCVACAARDFDESPPPSFDPASVHEPDKQPLGWSSVGAVRSEVTTRGQLLAFASARRRSA